MSWLLMILKSATYFPEFSKKMLRHGAIFTKVPLLYPMKPERVIPVEFRPDIVCAYLEKLPSKTGFSLEGVNQFVMRKCAVSIALPLSLIFNESFSSATVPYQWKQSVIVPIYKKGLKSDPKNYRPITLTSPICRLMEKIISNQIRYSFTKDISTFQYGFMNRRSCVLSHLDTISEWQESLKRKEKVDVIYFDFKKAFDMVQHKHLFYKLESMGLPLKILSWYKALFHERNSYVKVTENISEKPLKITSGVIQGSVSGPLLFLLFVNDIVDVIPKNVKYTLFADDLKIYSSSHSQLQNAIDKISEWSVAWELPLSPAKTSAIMLGKNRNSQVVYKLMGTPINYQDHVRDLGLIVDKELKFEGHINQLVKTCTFKCSQIVRSFTFKKPENYVSVYKTYVLPVIDYCSEVYCPNENSRLDKKLEHIQRKFTRQVYRKCRESFTSYHDRVRKTNLLTLRDRRKQLTLMMTHKLLFGSAHSNISKSRFIFSKNPRFANRLIRQPNTYLRDNWFFTRAEKLWNEFMKNTPDFASVSQIKQYLDPVLV